MSCFGGGFIFGVYVGGKFVDWIGFYEMQFWLLFLSGFIFIVLGQVKGFYGFCVMVFLASMVVDVFCLANFVVVVVYSYSVNWIWVVVLFCFVINLGWVVGLVVGGMVVIVYGYEWLFWVDGLICIVVVFFFWVVLFKCFLEIDEEEEIEIGIFQGKVYYDK